jgi:hypothetical protein
MGREIGEAMFGRTIYKQAFKCSVSKFSDDENGLSAP